MLVVRQRGGTVDANQYHLCANRHVAEGNWLVTVNPGLGAAAELCTSCSLTRARPNDADTAALPAFAAAEKAKRRLVVELIDLAWALNMVNRSMGRHDIYPFLLPAVLLEKMRFIHTTIDEMACDPAKLVSVGAAVREHVTGEYLAQQREGDSSGRLEGAPNA